MVRGLKSFAVFCGLFATGAGFGLLAAPQPNMQPPGGSPTDPGAQPIAEPGEIDGAIVVGKEVEAPAEETVGGLSEDEMMALYVKYSTPAEGHAWLKDFAGEWTVKSTTQFAPGAPKDVSEGTATVKEILGGRQLHQDYRGSYMGQPFNGHGLSGYDVYKKKHTMVWVDDMSTSTTYAEGVALPDGKTIMYTGTVDEFTTGEHDKTIEFYFTKESPDRFVFKIVDPYQNHASMVIEYTRKS